MGVYAEAVAAPAQVPAQVEVVDPFDTTPILRDEAVHERIDRLEAIMRRCLPAVDLPTAHHFFDGLYAREITIPAGTLLTGKIHRTEHLNVVVSGAIVVWSEDNGPRLIEAPCEFVAPAGVRKVGFALEDTVWTTVHANPDNVVDLDELELLLIEPREVPALADLFPPEAVEILERAAAAQALLDAGAGSCSLVDDDVDDDAGNTEVL
jgi:hypothetical protein